MLKTWLMQTFTGYSAKEQALGTFFIATDCIGIPLFACFYVKAAFWLASSMSPDITDTVDFSPPGYISVITGAYAFVTVLVLYQHCAVVPFPTEDTVDAWMVMQRIGRWVFLTRQTLCLQAIHATASTIAFSFSLPGLARATHAVAVLVAGMGIFVTSQYFALVHTHPDYVKVQKVWAQRGVPFAELMIWVHTPCGVFGVLDVVLMKKRDVLLQMTPLFLTLCLCYGVYVLAYLLLVHLNYAMTKHWPYAFMNALGTSTLRWARFAVGQLAVLLVFMSVALLLATQTRPIW
jgi:hypothetical protein